MKDNKNIILIGMMGAGKTTIGKKLAKVLHKDFIDMDDYLEEYFHESIASMFEKSETYFRENETKLASILSNETNKVISTGGGIVKNKINIDYLKENGIIYYIDRPISQIEKDVNIQTRPLLKDGVKKLYQLDKQRRPYYLEYCDYHIINDKQEEDVIEAIRKTLKKEE